MVLYQATVLLVSLYVSRFWIVNIYYVFIQYFSQFIFCLYFYNRIKLGFEGNSRYPFSLFKNPFKNICKFHLELIMAILWKWALWDKKALGKFRQSKIL